MTTSSVLLVHGAWHGGWCWEQLTPHLAEAGLSVRTVDLPSSGDGGDLRADAAVVRAALDEGDGAGSTLVVGHSYGGIAVSEGAAGHPALAHLVYLCAFQLDAGESLLGTLGGAIPPWIAVDEAAGTSTVTTPRDVFYGDVDESFVSLAVSRLKSQTLSSFTQTQQAAAWHEVDSTYVVCDADRAIPADAQRAMSGRSGQVVTLASSHSPFLSQPTAVAGVIIAAAGTR